MTVQNHNALPVMEHFYTIQGEGYNTGKAAYFIRLGGCDVGCTWCDVKASWNADHHPKLDFDALVGAVRLHNAQNIVITGGEPLLHNLDGLCEILHQNNFKLWIETSGSSAYSGDFDWICVSPKKFKPALPQVLSIAHELKVVVYHKSDIAWAVGQAAHCAADCRLYLQPEWGRQAQVLPLIIDFVKQNPRWQISLQTHKYLDIP